MIVYIETNFVFELALLQEQSLACEEILQLCEAGKVKLVLPAYSLVEPFEKLKRNESQRKKLVNDLNLELGQLKRTTSYKERVEASKDIINLLTTCTQEESQRINDIRSRLLLTAEIISLSLDILTEANLYQSKYNFETMQDAVVFASIFNHLNQTAPSKSCFLNKNTKDFDAPDVVQALKPLGCTLLSKFDSALEHIKHNS